MDRAFYKVFGSFMKKVLSIAVIFCMSTALINTATVCAAGTSLNIADKSILLMESNGNKTVNMVPYTDSVTITGTHNNNFVMVNNGEHNITLDNVTMPRIMLTSKSKLNLTLVGNNIIDGSTSNVPGIYVPNGAQLVITEESTGSLTVTGASEMAGIGGMQMDISGNITINGGTIIATGGAGAAGIGCADTGETTSIVINGGDVTAIGGSGAAGIGGGSNSNGTGIVISGGTVTATGGSGADAIGMGMGGTNESVCVSPASGYKIVVKESASSQEVLGEYTELTDVTSVINGKNKIYTCSQTAETPKTEIASLSIWDIATPVPGETPDYEVFLENTMTAEFNKSEDDGIVTVNGIKWHSHNNNDYISKTDTFCAGDNYYVTIALNIKDGYEVGGNTSCFINGNQANLIAVAGTNQVYATFYFEETQPFQTVSNTVTGIDSPKAGEHPDLTVKLANDECCVNQVRWYDIHEVKYITPQDTFEVAHKYRVELDLSPAENYVFATDEEGNLQYEFTFEFEGFAYSGTANGDKNGVTVSYTFNSIPITAIDISVDAPLPGYYATYIAYPDNSACNAELINWYDKTEDISIEVNSDYEFIQGHVYVATIDVFTVGDALFDSEIVATVNGLPAEVGMVTYPSEEEGGATEFYNMDIAIRISYEFEPCMENAYVTAEYDQNTHQVVYGYSLPKIQADNLDSFMCYVAFYQGNKLVEVTPYKTMLLNDGGSMMIPDNADLCKVMLWNKNTLVPQCDGIEISIPKSELN